MKFSVVIPTYNDWERLMKCIDALERQSLQEDQYEVIVINNNENGEMASNISLPAWIKVVHEPDIGSYKARNTGARNAKGEILAFTDSDCIPQKDWLTNAENCFKCSNCDLAGGRIKIFQSNPDNKYGYLYQRITAFPQHKNVPRGRGVTANLFVHKSVFNAVGGFDSNIKSGGDWEFTSRCTNNGYKLVYDKRVVVLHPARTLVGIFKKEKRLAYGGALNGKNKYNHSYLRILGSHVIHGPKLGRKNIGNKLSRGERTIIYSIDILKYFYRIVLYIGIFLRLINPNKIRE